MNRSRISALHVSLISAIIVASTSLSAVAVGVPAGTVIQCWSTATFTSADGTFDGESVSNVIQVTVAAKAGVSVSPPSQNLVTAPGRTLTVPAELHNVGNAPDTFALTSQSPSGWGTTVYVDDNGDGSRQVTENNAVDATASLAPDAVLKLLVEVEVPPSAPSAYEEQVLVTVQSESQPSAGASSSLNVSVTGESSDVILASDPERPLLGSEFRLSVSVDPPRQTQIQVGSLAPDGAQRSHTINTNAEGFGFADLTPDISGEWVFSASCPADDLYPEGAGTLVVQCDGPTYVLQGTEMISIPMVMSDPSPAVLFPPSDGVTLYRWIGRDARYAQFSSLIGASDDPDFQEIRPGEALWALTKNVTIAPEGRLVDQTQRFRMDLNAGWHQIGSPFLQPIEWPNTLVIHNGQTLSLEQAKNQKILLAYCWRWDTGIGYEVVNSPVPGGETLLHPWKGYWIFLEKAATLLLPPPPPSGAVLASASADAQFTADMDARRRDRRIRRPRNECNWLMRIAAESETVIDGANYLGVSSNTELYAIANPPRSAYYEDLYFPAQQGGRVLASDVRARQEKTSVWSFEVATSDSGNEHRLTWEWIEHLPSGYSIVLEDLERQAAVDMKAAGSYDFEFADATQPARFQVTVKKTK